MFNPIALRKAKTVYNFGLSGCNRVKLRHADCRIGSKFSFESSLSLEYTVCEGISRHIKDHSCTLLDVNIICIPCTVFD